MNPNPGTLLVVGIAAGLGAGIAETFVRAGYRVAGVSRRAGGDPAMAGLARTWGAAYRHYACDATSDAAMQATVHAIGADFGIPAVVVYNPMQLQIRPFLDVTPEEFESVWRTTCQGAMITARAVLPAMCEAGAGTLIFTGATASTRGSAKFSSLAAAKGGVRALAQSLAREFGPRGIHVAHTILDGLIWAPQTRARFSLEEEQCMAPSAIADSYLHLAQQPRSAWTHELDLRPARGAF